MKRLSTAAIVTAGLLVLAATGGTVRGQVPQPSTYTLDDIYYYLLEGRETTIYGHSLDPPPGSVPGDIRFKSLDRIYRDIKAEFDRCAVLPFDVVKGKRFFCVEAGSWGVQTGTGYRGLLVTGQTTSYLSGDDGYYEKGVPYSYMDNRDGTITDKITGLMWPKDGEGPGCFNGSSIGWSSALAWAEGLTFAGYSDWRLPNARELLSLVVDDASLGSPYINQSYFPNTKSFHYWTSTTYPPAPTRAFLLGFDETYLYGGDERFSYWVRAVRGGE